MLRNIRLANSFLQQSLGVAEEDCLLPEMIAGRSGHAGKRKKAIEKQVGLLKRMLASKACEHAAMLEARDAAVLEQRASFNAAMKTISGEDELDPRYSFDATLRVMDPHLHAKTQGVPITSSEIIAWCSDSTAGFPELEHAIWRKGLSSKWTDGVGLCAIIHAYRPALVDWGAVRQSTMRTVEEPPPAAGAGAGAAVGGATAGAAAGAAGARRERLKTAVNTVVAAQTITVSSQLTKEDKLHNLELAVGAAAGRLQIPVSRNLNAEALLEGRFDQPKKKELLQ